MKELHCWHCCQQVPPRRILVAAVAAPAVQQLVLAAAALAVLILPQQEPVPVPVPVPVPGPGLAWAQQQEKLLAQPAPAVEWTPPLLVQSFPLAPGRTWQESPRSHRCQRLRPRHTLSTNPSHPLQ